MNRFNPLSACIKCGNAQAGARYCESQFKIARTCLRCGHTWDELPLDTPVEKETRKGA